MTRTEASPLAAARTAFMFFVFHCRCVFSFCSNQFRKEGSNTSAAGPNKQGFESSVSLRSNWFRKVGSNKNNPTAQGNEKKKTRFEFCFCSNQFQKQE